MQFNAVALTERRQLGRKIGGSYTEIPVAVALKIQRDCLEGLCAA